jgi:hypothetical protein
MTLRVVGAGLGRTGTHSLKLALETLLGGTCYHMTEVFGRPDDPPVWQAAFEGQATDWNAFFADFTATVDWPSGGLWEPIADAFPDAAVLLSERDADSWWKSASQTIFEAGDPDRERLPDGRGMPPNPAWEAMSRVMLAEFCPDWRNEDAAKAAFLAHNDAVRATVDPARLIEWNPGDGWGPLCAGLDLEVPDTPYPHVNTTAEFRAMSGLD